MKSPEEGRVPAMHSQEREFSFSNTDDALRTLRKNQESANGGLIYIGTGISSFQSEPVLYGPSGERLPPMSDWEMEVERGLEGHKSAAGKNLIEEEERFPHFMQRKGEYVDKAAKINQNMFRFSLEFSRLCPREGEFDERLMADCVRVLLLAKAHGIEPMITLNHYTMPRFLVRTDENDDIIQGAWENPEAMNHFRFYIEKVASFLADDDKIRKIMVEEGLSEEDQGRFLSEGLVQYFLSINEPIMVASNGYLTGLFPPFKRGRFLTMKKVLNRLIEAHDVSRDVLKETSAKKGTLWREPQVGVAYNWQYIDGVFGDIFNHIMNESYTNKFERDGAYSDFLGMQYYFRMTAPLMGKKWRGREYGDHPGFGDIYPPGILEVMKKMNNSYPQKQIFITEFGFSDANDIRRPYWILETVKYVLEAKKQGLPIKGMLLWSLMDNLEWLEGMDQHFGLFNEKDLGKPLIHGANDSGAIRSWEVWQATADAVRSPNHRTIQRLQDCYEKAKRQYEIEVERRQNERQ